MSGILFAIALATAAAPSAEALTLGQALAETGTLATLLPIIGKKETGEILTSHPELSEAEQAILRETARDVQEAGTARVMAAMGAAYAEKLSMDELRALLAVSETPASKHLREIAPAVMAQTMQLLGQVDFKGETMAAFCKKTGKGCTTTK